jgi:Zn-dependent alcohol dehydrogenase
MAAEGIIDLTDTVTHTTDLHGIDEAFERMRRGEGARTLVILDQDLAG